MKDLLTEVFSGSPVTTERILEEIEARIDYLCHRAKCYDDYPKTAESYVDSLTFLREVTHDLRRVHEREG
jgi:hypothetical protein